MPKLQFMGARAETRPRMGWKRRLERPCEATSDREGGFTMIELLMVVAIIGILSAIVVPILASATLKANRTALAADGKALYSAFTNYYSDQGYFPSTSSP